MSLIKIICLLVLLCVNFISSFEIGNSEVMLTQRAPALEICYTSYNNYNEVGTMGLPKIQKKMRIKRQSAGAAPALRNFDNQFKEHTEHKVTGSSVIMKCEPKDTPTLNITWYKDDVTPVTRTARGGVLPVTYDMWSLLLNDLVAEDSGKYTCRVCNGLGCAEHITQLKIITPALFPRIKQGYPGNKTVLINASIDLSCPTINRTDYSTKWAKLLETSLGRNASQEDIFEEDKYSILDDTLTIRFATKKDEGWYTCITNNTIGADRATGFIRVVDFSSKPSRGVPSTDQETSSIIMKITWLVIGMIVSSIIVLAVFFKLRRNITRKQLADEIAREVRFEQWMRVVTIETARCNGYTPTGILLIPKVEIEKQRLSDVIEKFPDYVHHSSEYVLPADTRWEINRQYLTLGNVLGEGEFGRVVKAEYHRRSKVDMPHTVAVKMLKDGHADADMKAFVTEVEIMKMIGKHENIINLLGCCTKDGPFYVIVEYASNGSLRDYLKKRKPDIESSVDLTENLLPLKRKEMVEFALQVAKGMAYLASRGCIHRDLAARNVLVSGARVLKVADFGLARDVRDADYYRKRTAGKLPVRWMAPESLCHNYYTTKSDVWSFGVLTWEILTHGDTPYANIPAHYLYNYLRMGKRMSRPSNCCDDMYQLMRHCCSFSPDERPPFSELGAKLNEIYSNADNL